MSNSISMYIDNLNYVVKILINFMLLNILLLISTHFEQLISEDYLYPHI